VKSGLIWGVATLLLGACATHRQHPVPTTPTSAPASATVEELSAAIAADAQRSERGSDSKLRADLAEDAVRNAEACLARDPHAVSCLYGHAVALGLEARAHPTRASELLNSMLASLRSAEAADPNFDQAGPARVRALVLIRAPGWPLGPGDPDEGLAAARRAVALQAQYPPNILALAEALAKTGDPAGAQESYAQARKLAAASPPSADRDDWLRQADEGLRRR
jgi:hypothetical protein